MSSKKKLFWFLGGFLIVFSLALAAVYFYAVNNAEKTLETLVAMQSDGKLALKVTKAKIELSKLSFNFKKPILQTRDSTNIETGYYVTADNISISFRSLLQFIFKRKIVVKSVLILNPQIVVIKFKPSTVRKTTLTNEMGLVYKSLEDVLKVIEVNYLHIDNASFILKDKTHATNNTVRLSNLFLTIKKAKATGDQKNADRLLFTDDIQFDSFNQNLELNDGLTGLHYKHLSISSGSKFLKLDSCHFSINDRAEGKNKVDVILDSIEVLNVNYNLILKDGLLKIDSAICYNPRINVKLELAKKNQNPRLLKDSLIENADLERLVKKGFGDIDIGYLAVNNAKLNLVASKNNRLSSYDSEKINISFTKLVVIDNPAIPVRLDKFALAIKEYTAFTPDSLYTIKFDSVVVEKQKVALTNFSLKHTRAGQQLVVNYIVAKSFELNQINWNEFFYNHQFVADNISLIKPDVSLALPEVKSHSKIERKNKVANSFSFLQDKLGIRSFLLSDGSVNVTIGNSKSASLSNCFAKVKVENFLNDLTIENSVSAIDNLSFSKGTFANVSDRFEAENLSYTGLNGNLEIQQFSQTKADKSMKIAVEGISLKDIQLKSKNDFVIQNLSWTSANIVIVKKKKNGAPTLTSAKPKPEFNLILNQLNGGSVHFDLKGNDSHLSAKINSVSSDEISLTNEFKPIVNNLHVEGKQLMINQEKINGTVASFTITDRQASLLKNVKLAIATTTEMIKLELPDVQFALDINACLDGTLAADYITLNKPKISFEPTKVTSSVAIAKNKKSPKFKIERFAINDPHFVNLPKKISDMMKLDLGNAHLQLNEISSNGETIKANDIHVRLKNFGFNNEKIKLTPTGKEALQVDASNFIFNTATNTATKQWQINIDTVSAFNVIVNTIKVKQPQNNSDKMGFDKDSIINPLATSIVKNYALITEDDKLIKSQLQQFTDNQIARNPTINQFNDDTTRQTITVTEFTLENLRLSSENSSALKEILADNSDFKITNSTIQVINSKSKISFTNLSFNAKSKALQIENFVFKPALDPNSFMLTKAVQTPYIKLNTGKIQARNFDVSSLINENKILIQKINADSVFVHVYKDKRLPYNYLEKPMLTELIGKIPLKINLDTINVTHAHTEYEETNDKTLLNGSVYFNNLNGRIINVKNYDLTETDSLKFKVSSQFMNATTLKVNYAQSYYDSLAAFNITVHISPFDLKALNPLIIPTVSAKVNSGYLDTISLQAIGRRYVSLGAMKMYYHDLNIEYLDKGKEEHKTLKTKVVTLLAGAIVKSKNSKGTGEVYAERVIDKGFPNYWLRILLSGVITNTGLRTNKKQEKKYEKSIKKYKVPPIPEVILD